MNEQIPPSDIEDLVLPGTSDVAVSLTFDVDAESSWLGRSAEFETRLSTLSDSRFGVTRGLPRILDVLDEYAIKATFYVPGWTAMNHGDAVRELRDRGHEVGHHGHLHRAVAHSSAGVQIEEIDAGREALISVTGSAPLGYRAPGWEVTPVTFARVVEAGFLYDSSFMGDDRPYIERHAGRSLLELPVHWTLDDYPFLGFSAYDGGRLTGLSEVLEIWLAEFHCARRERRHVTYTFHPEVIGRAHRADLLRRLIDQMLRDSDVWFASHRAVATRLGVITTG